MSNNVIIGTLEKEKVCNFYCPTLETGSSVNQTKKEQTIEIKVSDYMQNEKSF